MARKSSPPAKRPKPKAKANVQLYTLDVIILSGPITEKFARKNPVISRTIPIRGDQTLEDLHNAIFDAFGRHDEHMYEFQFGKRPMDPEGPTYVLSAALDMIDDTVVAGCVEDTTLDSLNLKVGRRFRYWFDFGDDWWHEINVVAIKQGPPSGKFPRVIKRVGKSPPQYPNLE